MKTILKTTIVSIVASACVLSFSGCIDDRADFKEDLNVTSKMIELDPTKDHDEDGLLTGDEINKHGTDPENPDSDGDGLDDGLEIKIGTDPRAGFEDTDGDGVTDGIEVIGTYKGSDTVNDNGDVTTAGKGEYPIENGLLKVNKPISIKDFEGKLPANIHKNKFTDPSDKIDALDPMNDSDFDTKQNQTEKDDETNPLNQKDRKPWIYETAQGKVMEDAGFAYIPGGFDIDGYGNETGFWMAKREARTTAVDANGTLDADFVTNTFKLFNTEGKPSITEAINSDSILVKIDFNASGVKKSNIYPFEAAFMAQASSPEGGWKTTLPTDKQWTHIVKLMINDANNWSSSSVGEGNLKESGAYTVHNSILGYDTNVEESYKRELLEITDGNAEWTRTLIDKDTPTPGLDDFATIKDLNILPDWWFPTLNNNTLGEATKIGIYINIGGRFVSGDAPTNYIVMTRGGSDHEILTSEDNGIATADFGYGLFFKNVNIGFRSASEYIK